MQFELVAKNLEPDRGGRAVPVERRTLIKAKGSSRTIYTRAPAYAQELL